MTFKKKILANQNNSLTKQNQIQPDTMTNQYINSIFGSDLVIFYILFTGISRQSANYNSVDEDVVGRNSMGASSPEFNFPLMTSVSHNSTSELGRQIQFLSSSVVMSSSVTTTSPSSLSTGGSSIDSPPRLGSNQNSSGSSQPRTPSKLNVHAKEFVPSNLSIILSSPVEIKNSVLPHLTLPTAVEPTSPPTCTKPHPSIPNKSTADEEPACEWPSVEELHNPKLQESPVFPTHTNSDDSRTVCSPPLSPPLGESSKSPATVSEVTESNGVMGNDIGNRGAEYCSPDKETKVNGVRGSCSQQEQQQACSTRKPGAQNKAGEGSASGSDGGMTEACILSPRPLSPRSIDPACLAHPRDPDPTRTSSDGGGVDVHTHHPLPTPITSSSATPSQCQPLTLSQSSSTSSSSLPPSSSSSSSCPQPPKPKKSSRSWASVVGTSKTSVASLAGPVASVSEGRRTSLPTSDTGKRNGNDKRVSLGSSTRDCSLPDDCAQLRLKALGGMSTCIMCSCSLILLLVL